MINFLRVIFNKPTYQWTFWEECVFSFILIMAAAILGVIVFSIYYWHSVRMEDKKSKCQNCKFDNYYCREAKCFRCSNYKRPSRPSEEKLKKTQREDGRFFSNAELDGFIFRIKNETRQQLKPEKQKKEKE